MNPNIVRKTFSADLSVSEGERAVVATITTAVCDRDGEIVQPMGVNSKAYQLNPVVLYQHQMDSPPIGKCVSLKRTDKAIVAKTIFAKRPDDFPEAQQWLPDVVFSLYQQGVLSAFSIGFIPIETRPANNRDIELYGPECRRVIGKSELLEYSACSIPANQEAVTIAVSKGLVSAGAAKLAGFNIPDTLVRQIERQIQIEPPEPKTVEYRILDELEVVVKRIHRVIEDPKLDLRAEIAQGIKVAVAKRRGRIYM